MEDVWVFPPFQVKRKGSCYRQVPVKALERLYSEEFGIPDNECVLSCGSSVYGISDDDEVIRFRRFSDVDYMLISKNGSKKPYYKYKKNPRTDIDVLTFEYDSCRRGLEDGSLFLLTRFIRFTIPLFNSEDLYLELTSKAMSKMLECYLSKKDLLITPSYAMMKINDSRMYYEPYRWWSVNGEFVTSPNAKRNVEVYYDRVCSTLEELSEQGSLIRVDGSYPEPIYYTSNFVRGHKPKRVDCIKVSFEQCLAFLRGGNIPSSRTIIHVAYDGIDIAIGLLKGKDNCSALFDAKPELVKVQVH